MLAIHFLQRKARELPVSTLFLLERTLRQAAGGRRFERLLPSIPLWLQLLGVLLLTWLLCEPRFPRAGSVQRVALVMDSSASMAVFRNTAIERLRNLLPVIQSEAEALELTVIESLPDRPRLYTGRSVEELATALQKWNPMAGPVDPAEALRLARSLVSTEGTVLYVTDTPPTLALPYGASTLALGKPIENTGFTGVSFAEVEGRTVWRAMVRHYGSKTRRKSWRVVTEDGATEPRPLTLEPGSLTSLQGAFPENARRFRLVLEADEFPIDDVLPLVPPAPKALLVSANSEPRFTELRKRLLRSLESVSETNDAATADLRLVSSTAADLDFLQGNALVFSPPAKPSAKWRSGTTVTEAHPLVAGLNWQSLITREAALFNLTKTDTVLLRVGEVPLIALRNSAAGLQLVCNFDPAESNVLTQPSFIVLLHRFAERIRAEKIAPVSLNLEAGEPIALAHDPSAPLSVSAMSPAGQALPIPAGKLPSFAPSLPGYLRVSQGEKILLNAAVHFGDPREADFRACAAAEPDFDANAVTDRLTKPDPMWRLWLILLGTAALASWWFVRPRDAVTA